MIKSLVHSLASDGCFQQTFDVDIVTSGSMAEKTRVSDYLEHDHLIVLKPKENMNISLKHNSTIFFSFKDFGLVD